MKPMTIRSCVAAALLFAAFAPGAAGAAGTVTTARVSLAHNGGQTDRASWAPSVSGDGRYVAFLSDSAMVVQGDTNNTTDVFLHDRRTGQNQRVSVNSNANESRFTDPTKAPNASPAVTADGRFVAFSSGAWNLASGDTNELADVFVRDRVMGTTVRASVSNSGAQGNGHSTKPAISDDGRFVAFESAASNLVPGDTNGAPDVFVRDLQAGTTQRVSVRWDGLEVPKGGYGVPAISADGRFVAFHSVERLHPYDQNGIVDVYLFDRQTGSIEGGSLDSTSEFAQGNAWDDVVVTDPVIDLSADGRYVAFESGTPTLVAGDTNVTRDVFVRDRTARTTRRVSLSANGRQLKGPSRTPSISDDGARVAFVSDATDAVPGDSNAVADAFVHHLATGITERVSVTAGGAQADGTSAGTDLSQDGSATVFASLARNLVPDDTNGMQDVFVRGEPLTPPPPPPTITSPADSVVLRTSSVTFAGAATPGASVRVVEGSTIVATATTDGGGSWSSAPVTMADGLHSVFAIAAVDGVDSEPSAVRNFFVDTSTPLTPPTIAQPAHDARLNTTTVVASGSADPSVAISVTEGTVTLATTTASAAGDWSVTFSASEGSHTIVATATSGSLQASSSPRTFTVDLTAPAPPVLTSPAEGEPVYATPATLRGTAEPGATVYIYRDSFFAAATAASTTGAWSRSIALAEGENEIVLRARDTAGNFSAFSTPYTVILQKDAAPPTTTFDTIVPYNAYPPGADVVVTGQARDDIKVDRVEVVVRTLQNTEVARPVVTCSGCGTTQATWSATPVLGKNVYRVYVYAYDGAGQRSAQNFITIVRL